MAQITSNDELQLQSTMTLKERCKDFRDRLNIAVSPPTLYRYYKKANVTFKKVDLHCTNKLNRVRQLLSEQKQFVENIQQAEQDNKFICYMDETSLSLWSPLKRRTWSNGTVTLPYQSKRGHNMTVIGAICGRVRRNVYFRYIVVRKTNKETVRQFLDKLLATVPCRSQNLLLVWDNHAAHRSYYVRDFLRYKQVEVLFTPAYSSPLNSCEFVWALLKKRFAKEFAKKTRNFQFTEDNFKQEIVTVMKQVSRDSLTPKMLQANNKYCQKSL